MAVDSWDEVDNATQRELWWQQLAPKLQTMKREKALTTTGYMCYLLRSLAAVRPSVAFLHPDCGGLPPRRADDKFYERYLERREIGRRHVV